MTEIPGKLAEKLRQFNQQHLLHWWPELAEDERGVLVEQIEAVDFDEIDRLIERHRLPSAGNEDENAANKAARATSPKKLIRLPESAADEAAWNSAVQAGNELLTSGKVGVILVAGGQATRLGVNDPKGLFPIGPVSGASLYQILAEQLLARSRQAGVTIPYYVMTSEATHDETMAFFSQHDHFGLNAGDVHFFKQGNMPVVDVKTGQLLMEDKTRLALSPNGHGGLLEALARGKLLDKMQQQGIEYLYYHQVDNPTAIVCDPAFLGFHVLRNSELSTKVVAKRSAEERMGVVVDLDGKTQIIEYSDLPVEMAQKTDDHGSLLHWAGSTAIHIFSRSLFDRLDRQETELPFHVAHKKVNHLDETGRWIEPAQPNALKFERFIFDVLPSAERALVVETDRAREFNPVKNEKGDDSPETVKAAMTAIFSAWLKAAGADVDDDVPVEISPLFAFDADALHGKIRPGARYSEPSYLSGTVPAR